MITIYVAVQAVFGQEMWIVHADYPGGSGPYLADHAAVWYQTLGSAASVVLNFMSDALLVSPYSLRRVQVMLNSSPDRTDIPHVSRME